MNSLAENIKILLKNNGLSFAELSRQTDVPQPVLHKLATGKTINPNIATLRPIAQYFGVTCDQLMGYAELPLKLLDNQGLLNEVPIIRWKDVPDWHDLQTYYSPLKTTRTEVYVGPEAFALFSTNDMDLFSPNTLLIFSKEYAAKDNSFVLYQQDNQITLCKIKKEKGALLLQDLRTNALQPIQKSDQFLGVLVQTKSSVENLVLHSEPDEK